MDLNQRVSSKRDIMDEKNLSFQSVMQGRLDFFQACAKNSPLSGTDFQEKKEEIYYCFGIDYAPCNGIIEKREREIPNSEIDKAIDYFGSRKLPFIWWTASKSLETKGFQFAGNLTGIALDISKDFPKAPTSKAQVKLVQSENELKTFSEIAIKASRMPDSCIEQFQALFDSGMKKREQLHFLAYIDDVPVGTATLAVAPNSAGVWNLAVMDEYRKKGIGGALVHASLVEAQKRGYKQMMAILMPKGMAWGLFTKLGFQKTCDFPIYIYGASADELEK